MKGRKSLAEMLRNCARANDLSRELLMKKNFFYKLREE